MDVGSAIRQRRSVRAFLPDPLSEDVVRDLLDEARWAPSWGNAQDWSVYVVAGEPLDRVKAVLQSKADAGEVATTDIPMPVYGAWPPEMQSRMTYRRPAPGATPVPPQRPGLWWMYGAPALLLFAIDERLMAEYACFDAGLLVENVCLAALDRGLGTCIMAMAVRHPEVLREVVPESRGQRFVVAVALGRPDPDAPLNATERERVDLAEIVTWVG